jgi:hypothetical protein
VAVSVPREVPHHRGHPDHHHPVLLHSTGAEAEGAEALRHLRGGRSVQRLHIVPVLSPLRGAWWNLWGQQVTAHRLLASNRPLGPAIPRKPAVLLRAACLGARFQRAGGAVPAVIFSVFIRIFNTFPEY